MSNKVTVGVIGLGLIGGSYAKAFAKDENFRVLGMNRSHAVVEQAMADGVLDGELTRDNIEECDLIIPALYNETIIRTVREYAPYIRHDAYVIDAGGLKREVCEACYKVAHEYGFTFVGGHPMAGKTYSGYKYSSSRLYNDASLILCPEFADPTDTYVINMSRDISGEEHGDFYERMKELFRPCGFGRITVCSAATHDEMIAFTSELAHVVSSAYIKSPTARNRKGFSAGSYKDMTRVAWLNEDMWTEIFMSNRDNLSTEISYIIKSLQEYKAALDAGDADEIWKLLHEGKMAKEQIDGR